MLSEFDRYFVNIALASLKSPQNNTETTQNSMTAILSFHFISSVSKGLNYISALYLLV